MDFEIDWDRDKRTGVPEAVLCERKSAAQIGASQVLVAIARCARNHHRFQCVRL